MAKYDIKVDYLGEGKFSLSIGSEFSKGDIIVSGYLQNGGCFWIACWDFGDPSYYTAQAILIIKENDPDLFDDPLEMKFNSRVTAKTDFIRLANKEEKELFFYYLKEAGYTFDSATGRVVQEKWIPKEGEIYYKIINIEEPSVGFIWSKTIKSPGKYYYKTFQEAETVRKKLLSILSEQ